MGGIALPQLTKRIGLQSERSVSIINNINKQEQQWVKYEKYFLHMDTFITAYTQQTY
jgi:predicted DNA-binding ArsR family transcriptional regulator